MTQTTAWQPTEEIRALLATSQLLRSAVDALDGRMCVLDGKGTILLTNRLWHVLVQEMGWDPTECGVGNDFFALLKGLNPDMVESVRAAVEEVQSGRSPERAVKSKATIAGRNEFLVLRINPVRNHETARTVVKIVDITEAVRVETELNRITEEARLLSLVARYTDHGVLITNEQGGVEWINDAWTKITGYSTEDVLGRTSRDAMNVEGPGALPWDELSERLKAGQVAETTVRAATKDGSPYDLHMQLAPVQHDGVLSRTVCVVRDVTAQLNAERELRSATQRAESLVEELSLDKSLLSDVLSSIPQLVYWKDETLRYAGFNRAFLEVRGLVDQAGVLGRTESELGTQDALAELLGRLEQQVSGTRDRVENQQITIVRADHSTMNLLVSVLPQIDSEGRFLGVIGVAADVTHVSTLEKQLAQASRLESIGQLAAGIAHEINTPVQYVSDNTHFLNSTMTEVMSVLRRAEELAGGPDETARLLREALAQIDLDFIAEEVPAALNQSEEGLARVSQIVRAMKDFSHPGQGRAPADLNRAVESTVQVSRNEWRYVAELELDLDPDVGLVPCYEGELKQVLVNIIVNAAQAIAEQQSARQDDALGRITVSSRRGADHVRITVKDDGPGMPESVRTRIFDPFFTTKAVGKGTGQGLSMAYASVVNKHGGSLDVASAPGAGTTFTLVLPDGPRPAEA